MPDPRSQRKETGIYKITNLVSGKFYIGSATNIRVRIYEHNRLLNKGIHPNNHIQRAWTKYGPENFRFDIVEYCHVKELILREQYYMDLYRVVEFGYNINPMAGLTRLGVKLTDKQVEANRERNKGRKHSEETKKKMSFTQTGKKRRPFTELAKQNMSKGQKGKARGPISEETRKKMSLATEKRPPRLPCTDVTRMKLSIAKKGTKPSPQTIAASILSNKNRNITPETRERMSIAHRGKKMSPEYCNAMSKRITEWWQERRNNNLMQNLH